MATIFDFIGDVLFRKTGEALNTLDDESEYHPYMINRWCSMHSPEVARIVNETVNRYWEPLQDKQTHYKYMVSIIPKTKFRRITYITKPKQSTKDIVSKIGPDNVSRLAKTYGLSTREVKEYIKSPFFDEKSLKHLLGR